MTHARRGLKTLVLSLLAALGLMAAGAQAVTWDVAGKEIAANVTGGGKLIGEGIMLVPSQSLVFRCTTVTTVEATLRTDNTGHGKFTYSGCKVFIKGVENPGCAADLLPVTGKLLPILHSGRTYFLIEPLTAGQPFTVVHFPEDTCALPPLPIVTGSYVGECIDVSLKPVDCKEAKVVHYIQPAPEALFPTDELKYGLNKTIPHGEGEVFLTGANEGKTVNALAP